MVVNYGKILKRININNIIDNLTSNKDDKNRNINNNLIIIEKKEKDGIIFIIQNLIKNDSKRNYNLFSKYNNNAIRNKSFIIQYLKNLAHYLCFSHDNICSIPTGICLFPIWYLCFTHTIYLFFQILKLNNLN